MIKKVKIFGAGSIGNHLANASRRLNMAVTLCDINPDALNRAREEIYPGRYGEWDADIELKLVDDLTDTDHDLVIIGTPPDSHVKLALEAISHGPAAVLIEKPLATPGLEDLETLQREAQAHGVRVFVGYDHVVSTGLGVLEEIVSKQEYGELVTLDVDFREHWRGIFAAHPWLDGPKDTYLGFWKRGGGACGEHSHAINMWQHLAHLLNAGRIDRVSAKLDYVKNGDCEYDQICLLHVETENGLMGRIAQDVVTFPVRKESFLQFERGAIRWQCGGNPSGDVVSYGGFSEAMTSDVIEKTRPDDFIAELSHIQRVLETGEESPISLSRGLDTMLVIAAAHRSAQEQVAVRIDYNAGPSHTALKLTAA